MQNQVLLVLLMSEENEEFTRVAPLYREKILSLYFLDLGVDQFLWLNATEYEGWSEPALVLMKPSSNRTLSSHLHDFALVENFIRLNI